MELDTHLVDDATFINDVREPADFRGVSFSNYRKTEVKRAFVDNMHKIKLEAACYWCSELLCAGHLMDIWEILLYFMAKHIHLGNPRLVIYLESRFRIFRNILSQSTFVSELQLRNKVDIRKLFAEMVCILTLSPRKHSFEPIRINRVEEFDMTHMTERLRAPSVKFAEPVFQEEDPKELYIAVNEFSYAISREGSNLMTACYWIEWMLEFDAICRKRREICRCQRRTKVPVETKYQKDIIWMAWDAFNHYAKADAHGEFIERSMQSLLQLFSIKYTTACGKRRRYLLYFAVTLLTEPVPTNVEIVTLDHKKILASVVEQIHMVYRQIKKNELSPNTEYLFSGMNKRSTLEQSMRKLEVMETLGGVPRLSRSDGGAHDDDDDDVFV